MNIRANQLQENKSVVAAAHPLEQQNKSETAYLPDNRPQAVAQRKMQQALNNTARVQPFHFSKGTVTAQPVQKKENSTGLPDSLKMGVEALSGYSLDDVKVHYNSGQPAQLQAHAFAQGSDIHLATGQEKHLPHEAWHVVQQKQGRVKPTLQMKKVNVNDDAGLEKEADVMGAKAHSAGNSLPAVSTKQTQLKSSVLQRAPFIAAGKDENTDLLTYRDLFVILREGKEHLDEGTLLSMRAALRRDLAQPPETTLTNDQEKEFLLMQIKDGLLEIQADRLLLDVRILNLSQRLRELDKLPEEKVSAIISKVEADANGRLHREGLEAAQSYLKNLISALDHAQSTDQLIAEIAGRGLLEPETGSAAASSSASTLRPESKPNVASAIIDTSSGGAAVTSVSGGAGGRQLAEGLEATGRPHLLDASEKLIPARKGRYSAKAEQFFKRNTYLLEHTRDLDSEAQILDYFLQTIIRIPNSAGLLLDDAFNEVLPAEARNSVSGVILIHSDRTPCLSCGTIIDIFRKDFPNIQVYITFRREYGASMEGRFQHAIMGGTVFQYLFLKSLSEAPGPLRNPEDRSTDKERKDELEREALRKKEELRREQERKSESKKVRTAVRDGRTVEADEFLRANLDSLKAPERAAFDNFFDKPGFEKNLDNLLRAIVAAKSTPAKKDAIKTFLKPFLGKK